MIGACCVEIPPIKHLILLILENIAGATAAKEEASCRNGVDVAVDFVATKMDDSKRAEGATEKEGNSTPEGSSQPLDSVMDKVSYRQHARRSMYVK